VVEDFSNDENGYKEFLRRGGYVCNAPGMGLRFARVHRSACAFLNSSHGKLRTSYSKACASDLRTLVDWLVREHGRENVAWQYCAFCRPQAAVGT
jgi:hypothetical protein